MCRSMDSTGTVDTHKSCMICDRDDTCEPNYTASTKDWAGPNFSSRQRVIPLRIFHAGLQALNHIGMRRAEIPGSEDRPYHASPPMSL